MEKENIIQKKLEERYTQEEILWRQKSRIQWLKEGEKNNAFFHHSMIQRRQVNKITRLHTSQGAVIQSQQEIQEEFMNYFKEILSEPELDRRETIHKITQNIPHMVNVDKKSVL